MSEGGVNSDGSSSGHKLCLAPPPVASSPSTDQKHWRREIKSHDDDFPRGLQTAVQHASVPGVPGRDAEGDWEKRCRGYKEQQKTPVCTSTAGTHGWPTA